MNLKAANHQNNILFALKERHLDLMKRENKHAIRLLIQLHHSLQFGLFFRREE